MDSAKSIARDMLEAIHVDSSGFMGAMAKGFISFPVSLGYLGFDFIDTDNRAQNQEDKYRFATLIKVVTINDGLVNNLVNPFFDEFVSKIDLDRVIDKLKKTAGNMAGKFAFSELTGVNLGAVIASGGVSAFFSGTLFGIVLVLGAEVSRAIYTSRELRDRNPLIYYTLRDAGDLDLLYFLVKDIVQPFEKACEVSHQNPEQFDRICEYFLGGI